MHNPLLNMETVLIGLHHDASKKMMVKSASFLTNITKNGPKADFLKMLGTWRWHGDKLEQ